jgi:hypothetical protein
MTLEISMDKTFLFVQIIKKWFSLKTGIDNYVNNMQ